MSSVGFNPARAGWSIEDDNGFIGLVGPLWQRVEGERLAYGFLAEEKHKNRGGTVHGGMIAAFLDRVIGMNVSHARSYVPAATLQLDIHYLRAIRVGSFVEARTTIERHTRSVTFASATAMVGEDAVATAMGVWKILGER